MISPRAYAAVGLIAVGGLAVWYVMDLRSDLAACSFANAGLAQSLDAQNKAVEQLAQAGEAARKRFADELAKVQPSADAAAARVVARKALPAPKSCDAAFDLLDRE